MKKYLLAIMAMLAFSSAQAEISTSGLSETQKAELALQAAKMKETLGSPAPVEKAVSVNDAAVEGVKKWGGVTAEIGKGLVVGLAAAAKEANVAVNDFAVTPVGKITTAIIVWKMIGRDIVGSFVALLMLTVGSWVIWKAYRRMILIEAEYEYEPRVWGLYKKAFLKRFRRTSDEPYFFCTVAFLILEIGNGIVALANVLPK